MAEEMHRSPEAGLRVPTFEELEGTMALLRRQAERKFGPAVAGRLAGHQESSDDASQLEAGDWIMDCAAADDLLAHQSGPASGR